MRISVLLLAITLFCSVTSIVDRTYFNYLGKALSMQGSRSQRRLMTCSAHTVKRRQRSKR